MGRKENKTFTYTDDLTGEAVDEKEVQHFEFNYAGNTRELYLGPENAKKFKEFLDKSTRVKTEKSSSSGNPLLNDGWTSKEVRTWWEQNTDKLSGKAATFSKSGRIYDDVYRAFNKEHPAK